MEHYGAVVGTTKAPDWLDTDWLLGQFGERRQVAVQAYVRFLRAGVGQASPWEQLRYQVFLGDEAFVERFRDTKKPEQLREVPKRQRRALAKSLDEYRSSYPDRNEAMARAFGSGAYSMKEIGEFFGKKHGGQFSHNCIIFRTTRPTVAKWMPKCSAISR